MPWPRPITQPAASRPGSLNDAKPVANTIPYAVPRTTSGTRMASGQPRNPAWCRPREAQPPREWPSRVTTSSMSRTTKSGMNIEYLATDSPSNGANVKAIANTYTMP